MYVFFNHKFMHTYSTFLGVFYVHQCVFVYACEWVIQYTTCVCVHIHIVVSCKMLFQKPSNDAISMRIE